MPNTSNLLDSLSAMLHKTGSECKAKPQATGSNAAIHQDKEWQDVRAGDKKTTYLFYHYCAPRDIIRKDFSNDWEARRWGMINGYRLD